MERIDPMDKLRVGEDPWLIGAVAVVWAVLAALYEFVPALRMPGSSLLWGSGALVFLCISGAIAWTEWNVVEPPHGAGSDEGPEA
jgi:asparagine N-glycosylation enzyme membrane subunit Stt3